MVPVLSHITRSPTVHLWVYTSLGWVAHSRAHVAYESGEPDGGRSFLATWLPGCPREGLVYSHLVWHLAIAELAAGNKDTAFRLFEDAVAPEVHSGHVRTRRAVKLALTCGEETSGADGYGAPGGFTPPV